MMRRERAHGGRDGFTLIEVLAAFAIASVIIIATAALVRDVALHFDRGTRGVGEADRLMMAIGRLSADFASARLVSRRTEAGAAVAFMAEQASGEKPAKIMFVGAAGVASGPPGDEVVVLTVEEDGNVMRLVRRRAAWLGARTRFDDIVPQDPVVLIEGKFDIAFLFGRMTPEGALTWHSSWIGEWILPRFVRLILRDRATGGDLLGEADFVIRANAPAACGRPGAAVGCLSAAPAQAGTSPAGGAIR
jgi:prepilin-type N-terminal cleavage/methylation domain-containing protein